MLSFLLQRYKENLYAVFLPCRIIFISSCNRLHFGLKKLCEPRSPRTQARHVRLFRKEKQAFLLYFARLFVSLQRLTYIKKEQMNTNVLVTPSPVSAKYWSELKDVSDNVKLELITLLSSSMTHSEEPAAKPRKGWASRFAGVWKDSRSAEEIVEEIRAARTANTFDVEL